jgi:hypothetical protein
LKRRRNKFEDLRMDENIGYQSLRDYCLSNEILTSSHNADHMWFRDVISQNQYNMKRLIFEDDDLAYKLFVRERNVEGMRLITQNDELSEVVRNNAAKQILSMDGRFESVTLRKRPMGGNLAMAGLYRRLSPYGIRDDVERRGKIFS